MGQLLTFLDGQIRVYRVVFTDQVAVRVFPEAHGFTVGPWDAFCILQPPRDAQVRILRDGVVEASWQYPAQGILYIQENSRLS